MHRRFASAILILLIAATIPPPAAADWLAVSSARPAPPEIRTENLGPGRTLVELTVAGVATGVVTIDGRRHATVSLPGHLPRNERGRPALPFVTVSLTIPDRGASRVVVRDAEYVEFATLPVAPARGPILRTVDPATVPYEFGPAYAGGEFPDAVAELSRPYILRDRRGVNLRLFPVRWDVDRGVLRVLARATLEVVTAGDGGVNVKTRPAARPVAAFDALYARQFANAEAAAKSVPDPGEGPLLIICHDPFAAKLQPLVTWKRQRGVPVELITTSSVGGTVAGIQAAIDQRYHGPDGLAYVILVGDGAEVPHYTGVIDGADDDTHYVRLEGDDVYPDALISRISAQTASQVDVQVARILAYERDAAGAADWTHQAAGIASDEDGGSDLHDWERMDQIRDRLLAGNSTHVDRIYEHLGAGTADIATALNDGRSLVNYMGHGSGLSWDSVYFSTTDVHQLTNAAWPWIIDVSCLNGGISALDESLAEAFLRAGSPAAPHGAIGMYSSSSSCAWVEPTVMQHEAVALLADGVSNVLGVLVHAGIMEVLDQYGEVGVGLQLVEQYNLFGDCSLVVRTTSPAPVAVSHQPLLPLFAPSLTVETDAPGATVTVSGAGVIHGTAHANSQGRAEVVLTEPVAAEGSVTLTVFGVDRQTYQALLPVVDVATVAVQPPTVPVGATTPVTVTVVDPDGGLPLAGVQVGVEGFGFTAAAAATDTAGRITVDVAPAYGEVLRIRGREPGAGYDLFVADLPVTGAVPLNGPTVTAAVPDIALGGALTPGRTGTITAALADSGFTLFVRGDGLDLGQATDDTTVSLPVAPVELSPLIATIGRPGQTIFQQEIAVITALGTLAGSVVDTAAAGAGLAEATVTGRVLGGEPDAAPDFVAVTDSTGAFAPTDPLPVGDYAIEVVRFGYAARQDTVFVLYGANERTFGLGPAPDGTVGGTVTAAGGGEPLVGTVTIRRADTDELIATVPTDSLTGAYVSDPLPYYDYRVEARSFRFVPASAPLTVAAPSQTVDFTLEAAPGEILLLADGDPEDLVADLEALIYNVTVEGAAASDPGGWNAYDLVVYTAGTNGSPLADAQLRTNLIAHEQVGGRLLVEGGDVAFAAMDDPGFPVLAADVLHVAAWHGDAGGEVAVSAANHPVMLVPNIVVGPIEIAFFDWGVSDRVSVTPDADLVGAWTDYADQASVICHDDDPVEPGGQIVFFTFAYGSAGAGRLDLLENAVVWLTGAEPHPLAVGEPALPAQLVLAGNHPNPFNPRTVIRFALPQAGPVDLAVYDLRGRRVRTLVRADLPAGSHEVAWQGRDDADRPLASGIYVTRLEAGGERRVGKMTLLK